MTRLDEWTTVEESEGFPRIALPACVGSGKLGVGLDASGLQGLPDCLAGFYQCRTAPFHVTQAELYVLHDGMISEHLYRDEAAFTGRDLRKGDYCYGMRRNFLPLGYLSIAFEISGREIAGAELFNCARSWRRIWNLRTASLATSYRLDDGSMVEVEVFARFDGESVFVRGIRRACAGTLCRGTSVILTLETRHGIPIFDSASVDVGQRSLLAVVPEDAPCRPSEPYTVVYGAAADGGTLALSGKEMRIVAAGSKQDCAEMFLRLDFRRLAGSGMAQAESLRDALENELGAFTARDWFEARDRHMREWTEFWDSVAGIEFGKADEFLMARLHLFRKSQYLSRCGNDADCGGTAQYLLFHQNGWGASNFHDHHYIIDGAARAGLWQVAEKHLRWLRRVMRPEGRPFPWMMTYDGSPTCSPERDRAPMADANRALLAARLYEMAGAGRRRLLEEKVYPIVRRVALAAVQEWWTREGGRWVLKGVENDIMGDAPIINDAATICMFLSVLRKAAAYSAELGVDADLREKWLKLAAETSLDVVNGRYRSHRDAPPDARSGCWLNNIFYIAEAWDYLDAATMARTRDHGEPVVACNIPWTGFAAASSEIRIGRPDRAEQFFVDAIENRTHGPGYFEECSPVGVAALPPFATAHGAYLTASCEQFVLSDFWRHRIWIGRGLPCRLAASEAEFRNLRARDGLIVSGRYSLRRFEAGLRSTGEPVAMEVIMSVPAGAGTHIAVSVNGEPAEYVFQGEEVGLSLSFESGEEKRVVVEG